MDEGLALHVLEAGPPGHLPRSADHGPGRRCVLLWGLLRHFEA